MINIISTFHSLLKAISCLPKTIYYYNITCMSLDIFFEPKPAQNESIFLHLHITVKCKYEARKNINLLLFV
jgi:hypothetical protein